MQKENIYSFRFALCLTGAVLAVLVFAFLPFGNGNIALAETCGTTTNVFRGHSFYEFDSCINKATVRHWVYQDATTWVFKDNYNNEVIRITGNQARKQVECLNGYALLEPGVIGYCEEGRAVFTRLSATSARYECTNYDGNNDSVFNYICQKPVVVPPIVLNCGVIPASIYTGQSFTFTPVVSGGTGTYSYNWSGACTGTSSTCTGTYPTPGLKSTTLVVTSGALSSTIVCSVNAVDQVTPHHHRACYGGNAYWYDSNNVRNDLIENCGSRGCSNGYCNDYPALSATCAASPSTVEVGENVLFTANAGGGTGSYTYNWSGAGSGSNRTYSRTFNSPGSYTATVAVASGGQTASANCTVVVNQSVTPHHHRACYGGNAYWYDSNNVRNDLIENCGSRGCSNGYCNDDPDYQCDSNSDCGSSGFVGSSFCQGNGVYRSYVSYICHSPGTASSYCSSTNTNQLQTLCYGNQTCSNGSCSGNSCTPNYQQTCYGNSLYWYDSCGTRGNLIQYCANGCYNNSCQNNNNAVLNVSKTVRNLTTGSGFASSIYANPSDVLMFMITLQASGDTDLNNVVVRDSLPANLISRGELIVSCSGGSSGYSNCGSGNYNYSGNIVSGISLGTVYRGQTVNITYQVQVADASNFPYGTSTLYNNVLVTSSNSSYTPIGNATVIVSRTAVLGATYVPTGLTNNLWADSFLLPLLLAAAGIIMFKTGMFVGVEKWLGNKKLAKRELKNERELANRIADIQSTERT